MAEEKILLIVESPNKCSTIKKFLPKNYTVMASVGHISGIKDGGTYFNTGIDPSNNFKTDYAVSSDKKEVVAKLQAQVKISDKVIIATDGDREGEAIAWSLKHFLKIPNNKYERVTFNEITKSAVTKALANPRKIDDNLVNSAQSRGVLDKIIGYRMSPIARQEVNAKSVGRCQSAGLKLITNREKEIINFKVDKFYEVWLHFTKDNCNFKAKYKGIEGEEEVVRINTKEEVKKIMETCDEPFIVVDIKKNELLEYPKAPFTTSTFTQEVSSKLGISVKDATSKAQKLFEGVSINGEHIALISYIRTDSSEISEEFQPVLESFVKQEYGNTYYSPIRKSKKTKNAQEGHEAIRCLDLSITPEMLYKHITDESLIKVYEIIRNRTLASMMRPAIYSETVYTIIGKNKHIFKNTSKELIFDGYKKVYNYKEETDEENYVETITFAKGEKLSVLELNEVMKETKPPKRFNEASFIKELESSGIGRPSTFASILNTILDAGRGYCEKKQGTIHPTDKGMQLSDFLEEKFSDIINLEYTSKMEDSLDLIAKDKLDYLGFLTEFYNTLEGAIKASGVVSTGSSTEVCPNCGKPMVIRKGKFGLFSACSGYPECKTIKNIPKKK